MFQKGDLVISNNLLPDHACYGEVYEVIESMSADSYWLRVHTSHIESRIDYRGSLQKKHCIRYIGTNKSASLLLRR
jgi:hypothetical protein